MVDVNLQISESVDDCYRADYMNIFVNNSDSMPYGNWQGSSNRADPGLRWRSVNIPNSSTITSAKLSVYMHIDAGSPTGNIYGVDEDNVGLWVKDVNDPWTVTKTTAFVSADEADWNNWGIGWIDIDITSCIQEIVDRPGWSANNSLAVILTSTNSGSSDYIFIRAIDGDVSLASKLEIVYSAAPSGNPYWYYNLLQRRN